MLTTLQICLLSVIGFFALLSIIFTIMFIVTISKKETNKVKRVSIKEVIETNKKEKEEEISVDEMLENLEKQTQEEVKENEITEEEVIVEEIIEEKEESTEENIETKEENSDDEEDSDDVMSYEKIETEAILAPGTLIDYKTRLEKVISSKDKLERDLAKIDKFILKYERTDRRKARNQKMLDRRAGELTNLNLLMYSVTDIKNVDEDKKVKQEELTAHIAELKASIQDAEEYLESNREKYNHNVKMSKFLNQEKTRLDEEIVELEKLIKSAEENN